MKRLWEANKKLLIYSIAIVAVWRIYLFIVEVLGKLLLAERGAFIGPIPWANFDGIHYLLIAERGYGLHQHAFFPLFPALIHLFAPIFGGNYVISSLFLVHSSLIVALVLLWKLVEIDFGKEVSKWSLAFLLLFPTAFFLGSVYTESLFLILVFGSFYAARKGHWLVAGVFGAFASATRFIGIFLLPALILEYMLQTKIEKFSILSSIRIFAKNAWGILLIPFGLFSYMYYLSLSVGDSLAFVHTQPAFGANRSADAIILLPQVVFRYIKIFLTVPLINYDYWVAFLEIASFFSVLIALLIGLKKVRLSYIVYSLLAIVTPTMTGTFSSMPRYVLVAFPIFILFASLKGRFAKFLLSLISLVLFMILTMLFVQGYFVA